jgi:selenide,water dikinase
LNRAPVFKEIVLVGGGHTHALVMRMWAMKPLPGVRLTLISPQPQTPYSGMLPGLIAGHYSFDQTHIDLPRTCQWAGVRFVQDQVTSIDPVRKTVQLAGRPDLHYDLVSIDIGSTPQSNIAGVEQYATAIKPIAEFHSRWLSVLQQLRVSSNKQASKKQTLVVVGGGAGSVETILAMAWAIKNDPVIKQSPEFKLLTRSEQLLPGYPRGVLRATENALKALNINWQTHFSVEQVTVDQLTSTSGQTEQFDQLFWCTQAGAADWPRDSALGCNDQGFIRVNPYLQSVSHSEVFATGDIAYMDTSPRPKAGVYAVRQAPILFHNLRATLLGQALKPYKPQDDFLSLLALGDKKATGSRKPFSFTGRWVWNWKDHIDLKFMNLFHDLPEMEMDAAPANVDPALIPVAEHQETLQPLIRCAGCGAKIGPGVLSDILTELTGDYRPEDATTVNWPDEKLIQTIDQIKSPIDDPYLFGRIAVFHALSDLYAMNATPHSLQLAVTLPFAGRTVQGRELRLILQGVLSACQELNVTLLGGHSAEGSEVSLAITANGLPDKTGFTKTGLRYGDLLVLSKPLGTGIIMAGQMSHQTEGKHVAETLRWMNQSNRVAALSLAGLNATGVTDITGFGLLGHLQEMIEGKNLTVELQPDQIPVLPGSLALAERGIHSSLHPQNELNVIDRPEWQSLRQLPIWPLLLDPQTSGGLLAGIHPDQQQQAEQQGFTVIGVVKRR